LYDQLSFLICKKDTIIIPIYRVIMKTLGARRPAPRWRRTNYNSQRYARRTAPIVRRDREGRGLYKPPYGAPPSFFEVAAWSRCHPHCAPLGCLTMLRNVERGTKAADLPAWQSGGPLGHIGRRPSERGRTP
uniref:Uncharacterized protein n=2 Tax=Sus scrofa TaxID=9823 RepID=A0A8D1PFF0_PIG